jgi:hypothetical protein
VAHAFPQFLIQFGQLRQTLRRTYVDPAAGVRSPVSVPAAMAASSRGRSFMTVPGFTPAKKDGEKTPMPA